MMSESLGAKGSAARASPSPRLHAFAPGSTFWPVLALVAVLTATVIELRWQGRRWWCSCGRPDLWWGDTHSAHNSQHLFDPYSFTHVLHGVLLYGLLRWALPRFTPAWRLWVAVALEAVWEMIENTNFVIERYRTATASLGYHGDTVANSLGDILSCVLGFVLAGRLGLWGSLVLFVVTEVTLLLWIKDSLVLDILMLVRPIDAIKHWQLGP